MTLNEPVSKICCALITTPFCIYIKINSKDKYLAHKYLLSGGELCLFFSKLAEIRDLRV